MKDTDAVINFEDGELVNIEVSHKVNNDSSSHGPLIFRGWWFFLNFY